MSGIEVLQSVQFVTVNDKRVAVIDADDWESLIEWLEEVEDQQIVRESLKVLRAVEGDRKRAGWHEWRIVAGELE